MAPRSSSARWKLLPAFAVFIVGLVLTAVLALIAQHERGTQTQQDVESAADTVADEVLVALDEAILGAERTIVPMAVGWPSSVDYQSIWNVALTSLPGDAAIQTVLQIPADQLELFVTAEQAADADFAIQFLNPMPPLSGHVITARTSPAEAFIIGADHSSFDGSEALLERTSPGMPSIGGSDMRKQVTTVPGQIQVAMAHQIPFSDGVQFNAWTIVQVDAATVIAEATSLSTEHYGITVTSPINPELTSLGISGDDAMASATRVVESSYLTFEVQVRSGGTVPGLAAPMKTLVTGFVVSLIATALAVAATLLVALMRRAEHSEQLASRDDLTGLPNRRWLREHLEQGLIGDVALLFCDLDRFKVVNDSVGHAVGDELLVGVANRIAELVGDEHAVARFGGDEFIVVCEPRAGQRSIDVGSEVAERLVATMAEPFNLGTTTFRASMSIGVACGPVPDRPAAIELIRQADTALAECKHDGGNGFRLYDDQLRDAEADRLNLEAELQVALDRGDMVVHYQPLVDSAQQIYSLEALVRWNRNGILVPPGIFLPVVAAIGRMGDLGAIVRAQAIAQLAKWSTSDHIHNNLTMHINVDAAELIDPTFPDRVLADLDEHQLNPSQLVLEVTEDKWLDFDAGYLDVFQRLADLGIGIAIDDFGMGYSSIARVLLLPGVTEVKIDRSVVAQVDQAAGKALIVGLVGISRELDIELLAEGVETIEEHRALLKAGITKFQGYLFARPAPAETALLPDTSPIPSPAASQPLVSSSISSTAHRLSSKSQ